MDVSFPIYITPEATPEATELKIVTEWVNQLSFCNRYVVFNVYLQYKASYKTLARATEMCDFSNHFYRANPKVATFKIYDKKERRIL